MSDTEDVQGFGTDEEAEAELARWPNCAVPDCENKATLWAGTGRCHPCSVRLVGRVEMDRRYTATRNPDGSWNGMVSHV